MTYIPFAKMQSAGNDFIFIDGRRPSARITRPLAQRLLHRQRGIGGDQLLLLGKPSHPDADFSLRIFNPDGSEAEMCGNGVLCVADYLHKTRSKRGNGRFSLTLETRAGLIRAFLAPYVEVDMGEPVLEASRIPVRGKGQILGKPLRIGERTFKIHCVSMGNPHCVIFVDRLDKFPVETYGPLIEKNSLFPKRANVEFVEVLKKSRKTSSKNVKVRVWERGAGATLSCGTGACAVLVAGVLTRRLSSQCDLEFPGGMLRTRWASDNHVYLASSSMNAVFEGRMDISSSLVGKERKQNGG